MDFIDWVEGEKAATRGTKTILLYGPSEVIVDCLFISLSSQAVSCVVLIPSGPLDYFVDQLILILETGFFLLGSKTYSDDIRSLFAAIGSVSALHVFIYERDCQTFFSSLYSCDKSNEIDQKLNKFPKLELHTRKGNLLNKREDYLME